MAFSSGVKEGGMYVSVRSYLPPTRGVCEEDVEAFWILLQRECLELTCASLPHPGVDLCLRLSCAELGWGGKEWCSRKACARKGSLIPNFGL